MSEYSLICGDAVTVMRGLPANSVQCCVTSPPYFGLRDYGTATWDGGDAECDHVQRRMHMASGSTLRNDGRPKPGMQETDKTQGQAVPYRDTCGKCGARRIDNQIGLEPTPEAYVAALVEVFREVRRVLHPSGVVFLNLGDSYNGSGGAGGDYSEGGIREGQPKYPGRNVNGLGPKQLLGMPWRTAFALQADGWILRSAITWCKGNPMPESVTDRCTSATEMVFMLTKSATYYYDAEAVREPTSPGNWHPNGTPKAGRKGGYDTGSIKNPTSLTSSAAERIDPSGRNRRNWWLVNSEQFAGSHFAVMPTKLVEPCILAGSKVGDTILDPFCGSGTTGYVALRHHRRFIGIDLNADYLELAHRRIQQSQPLLFTLEVTP